MSLESVISAFSNYLLFTSCLFILGGCLLLTYKTNFIQFRSFPLLLKMIKSSFFKRHQAEDSGTVSPRKALFTAMSTTLGISSIVAPIIAIHLGGPGALIGFLFTAFFGGAATYVEVNLSITHRKQLPSGEFMGGPMQYLEKLASPKLAKWYATCCLVLMTAWSGGQANQLAAILDSPLLGNYRIPAYATGIVFAIFVITALLGGIKRISALSAKLVPTMFTLYIASTSWILFSNLEKIPSVFSLIFESMFSPYAMANGTLVGGALTALRWGVFKGIQASEAGIGTQSFPHSAAKTQDPKAQATLAMLSTYTAGIVAFLSGCIAIITDTWQDHTLPLGISMVASSFFQYFSYFGVMIITTVVVLFSFGTSLGNSYNGTQCFSYLTKNKKNHYYILGTGVFLFAGAIAEVKTFWSLMDIVLALTAVPHMGTLVWSAFKKPVITKQTPAI
jgi:alanine or glycine:cation symporter, AGCS family